MTTPTILALDVGFQAMGIVVAQGRTVIHCETIRTEKSNRKQGVRVADDDVARCQALTAGLMAVLVKYQPAGVIAEMPSGGAQGARANRSMGMATAVVAAVLEVFRAPLEVVTPQAVKYAATGCKDGSKADVEAAVLDVFAWGNHLPKIKAEREHICDAAGALLAAEGGTLMRTLERMAKGA